MLYRCKSRSRPTAASVCCRASCVLLAQVAIFTWRELGCSPPSTGVPFPRLPETRIFQAGGSALLETPVPSWSLSLPSEYLSPESWSTSLHTVVQVISNPNKRTSKFLWRTPANSVLELENREISRVCPCAPELPHGLHKSRGFPGIVGRNLKVRSFNNVFSQEISTLLPHNPQVS